MESVTATNIVIGIYCKYNKNQWNEYMNDNFEILYIDLGRYDINMSSMDFFDIMPQQGIPRVVILNKDKEVVNIQDTGEWTTARSRTKQEIFNYFQEYKE